MNVLGLCIASLELEAGRIAADIAKQMGGNKEATIVGIDFLVPAANAALANGTTAHVLDYDDTHNESFVHVGPPVIPAALAMGERQRINGRALILAIAAGMETAIRVGRAAPGQIQKQGFHATSVFGTFGAIVASAKILGLSRDQIVNSLGIGGSQASGIYEFFSDGTWVKQFHPGWAAHAGIIAALMAQKGMTGPRTVFEGRFGIYKTHLGRAEFSTDRVLGNLGNSWQLTKIAFKPYPCGVVLHPFLRCASILRERNRIDLAQIAEITCTVPSGMVPLVCEPASEKLAPRTVYDCKFSLPFTVAAMLVDGRVVPESFSEAKIDDARILRLAKLVKYIKDDRADYPRLIPGRVSVRMRNGKTFSSSVRTNPGGPEMPMTRKEHVAKFMANVSDALGGRAADRIVEKLDSLEDLRTISELMKLCRRE